MYGARSLLLRGMQRLLKLVMEAEINYRNQHWSKHKRWQHDALSLDLRLAIRTDLSVHMAGMRGVGRTKLLSRTLRPPASGSLRGHQQQWRHHSALLD
jgi:hypothetical protein